MTTKQHNVWLHPIITVVVMVCAHIGWMTCVVRITGAANTFL